MLEADGDIAIADALTSHGAYWSDPSFGAFMLAGESRSICSLPSEFSDADASPS